MVTIDPNHPVSGIADLKRNESSTRGESSGFDTILQETVGKTEPQAASTETQSVLLSNVRPAQFDVQTSPSGKMLAEQVEQLIDTMAQYQQKLADEGATLKTIAPLVEKMAQQNESLGTVAATDDSPDGLRTILDQSLALSSMEIARFRNGQYNE